MRATGRLGWLIAGARVMGCRSTPAPHGGLTLVTPDGKQYVASQGGEVVEVYEHVGDRRWEWVRQPFTFEELLTRYQPRLPVRVTQSQVDVARDAINLVGNVGYLPIGVGETFLRALDIEVTP